MKYIIAIVLFSITATTQQYKLDIKKSQLKWTGKAAFSTYTLSGQLKAKNGNLILKNDQLTDATILINMKSLSSDLKDLTKHLKSKDFFEVKQHTTASFKLIQPIDLKDKKPTAIGQLTIKGITKNYAFPLNITAVKKGYQVKGKLKINRTDFDIFYNSPNYFEGLKQQAIADKFELELDLWFE